MPAAVPPPLIAQSCGPGGRHDHRTAKPPSKRPWAKRPLRSRSPTQAAEQAARRSKLAAQQAAAGANQGQGNQGNAFAPGGNPNNPNQGNQGQDGGQGRQ
jgi:hypothetical protein